MIKTLILLLITLLLTSFTSHEGMARYYCKLWLNKEITDEEIMAKTGIDYIEPVHYCIYLDMNPPGKRRAL